MHSTFLKYILITLTVFGMVANCSKILVLVPFPASSHWFWLHHFVVELLDRGHQVTAITNFAATEPHPNYTEVVIDPPFDMPYYFPVSDIFEAKYSGDLSNLFLYWHVGISTTKYALRDPNVQHFIEQDDSSFDLVISEQFYQEAFLMFAHKYRAPIVTIGTLGYSDFMDRAMGLLTPWSFVPHPILTYMDDMSFSQRCYNFLISATDALIRKYYYLPRQDKLAKKYFSTIEGPESFPSVEELERSISVMLINSHISTTPPRPSITGLVNVAGAHIKQVKALPKDIQRFLNSATEGAIFFSLGSYVKSTDMPKDKLKAFFEVFRNIKHKVLWKFEDETMTNVPKNVMVRNWLPQSDILAHPNVVLFITHGGMFGTQEAIYRGVPMLLIPFFGDQHQNTLKAERSGYALSLNFADVNVITLGSRINELLTDPSYKKLAKKASELFRDNLVPPMEEAMHWIEYVIRHKGAKHLKSVSVDLNWIQYHMLDVIAFFTFTIVLILFVSYKILSALFRVSAIQKSKEPKKYVLSSRTRSHMKYKEACIQK
ncbi:UDP-glycosyltransferase UGT5-like isoform X2 [Wyeomyia smithii]|uniref:UDP-glycosyltransferase UGT5-like isoform X2 n=1 Tax=Wyeomyia smithii TaxID=174621 RepID=UPI002467EA45|nr:UDP-glycosyltransferase UGT5-like isoform X2 [Wyeomyia smithii]